MTQQSSTSCYDRFYDQVLNEISTGKVEQGINVLVGMLDAIALQGGALEQARTSLQGHLLHQMLLEDPLCAYAKMRPGDSLGLAAIMASKSGDVQIGATGQKLFAATRSQPIARALLHRQASVDRLLSRAISDGQSVLDCRLSGTDAGGSFALICASDLADRLESPALTEALAKMRTSLSDRGRIILSSALPNHLGAGWRSVCLNWNPNTHDEQGLTLAAASAGLTARTYRDEADCFVWAELRPQIDPHSRGGESHGY